MFVYSPENVLPERIREAKKILQKIPYKHAFITGSFLYQKEYKDIDVFILSKTKKQEITGLEGYDVHFLDFNQTSSLFFHSLTKRCVSKSVLPITKIRVRLSDYWELLNQVLTPIAGDVDINKEARMAVLYTHYLLYKEVPDSLTLKKYFFKNYSSLADFLFLQAPKIFQKHMAYSYLKRFFYSRTRHYEEAEPIIHELIKEIISRKASS